MYVTQSTEARNDVPEQLELFDRGTALTEVAVSALTTEPELRDIGRALIDLTRYHASKIPGEVGP